MQVDAGGCRWMQVDAGGCRWIEVDGGGWRWMQAEENSIESCAPCGMPIHEVRPKVISSTCDGLGPRASEYFAILRVRALNSPNNNRDGSSSHVSSTMFALLFDLEDYATTYRATRDAYLKAANELKLATGPYKASRDAYVAATATYTKSLYE